MSRPTDWSVLDLYRDPVPGDWSDVRTAALRYASIADTIAQAKRDLTRVFEDEQLSGEAIDAVRETALQVADRIGRAKERYQGVADALSHYITPLHTAQDESIAVLNSALNASGDRQHAQHEVDQWERKYNDAIAAGDADGSDHAKRMHDSWQQRFFEFSNDIHGAVVSLNRIIAARDKAAEHSASLIENIENSGGLNDDFWDKVDEIYDNNPWIDDAVKWAGYIAAALAVIAMFVPGLNLIVLAISIVVAVAIVANAWAKAGTGRESVGQAIFDTVMAVIPFGVGKVFSIIGKAGTSTVVESAADSIMHSAAGSGLSGLTKPIATGVIEQFLERGPVTTLTSKFTELLNLNALAKAPILMSGGVGAGIAGTLTPVAIAFGVEAAYTGAEAFVSDQVSEAIFGDSAVNSWQNANW